LFHVSERFFLDNFLFDRISHSIVMHVFEFLMNQTDLFVSQSVGLSVDKALDGSDLISINEIWVISIVVD
jgi:hypothetical protein